MTEKLKRQITLIPLVFYGVGTILGAGIYVIISEVASSSGDQFPLSFLLASVVAIMVGLSYSELSSRFPRAAGEAVYAQQAFNSRSLYSLIGYAVALTGIVSAATILKGLHGYLDILIELPPKLSASLILVLLGLVAIKGIKESTRLVAAVTLIEIFGLILVIFYGAPFLKNAPALMESWSYSGLNISILHGAFIAFFAFIGFEDMVNTAEEVIDAKKTLPRAIVLALIISTSLYFIVSLICAVALPIDEITASKAPLALIISQNSALSPKIMGFIGIVAILNGVLVQIIMVSRMFYGLSRLGVGPKALAVVSKKTSTPINASLLTIGIIWVLALLFPLGNLAKTTSFITLVVFGVICSALINIKLKKTTPEPNFKVPLLIPILGLGASLVFLISFLSS